MKNKINIHLALSRLNIQNQIRVAFLFAIAIPISLLCFFTAYQSVNILYKQAYSQLESDNLRIKSIVFDATLNFYNISEDIINDDQLKNILEKNYKTEYDASKACEEYSRLNTILINNTSISSMSIYTTNDKFKNNSIVNFSNDKEVRKWFSKTKTPGSLIWESHETDNNYNSPALTLVRSFPLIDSNTSAILVLRMSTNYLKNRIQNNSLFVSLSIDHEPIFFSTQRSLQGSVETAPIDYSKRHYQRSGNLKYLDKKALFYISSFTPYMSNSNIYITSMDFNYHGYVLNFMLLCGVIVFISIFFPFIIISIFAKKFSSRVDTLKIAMHNSANGDYNIIKSFEGDDELSTTFSDLRNLIANVKKQQSKIYESQIKEQKLINEQQKMEYRLLASQINPHFIYNTLETIRMMALEYDAKDVSSAIAIFGKTMRYVLENTKAAQTTLKKELDYIKNYLSIQKLRFYDKINYTLIMPKDFSPEKYQILPLLLQPVVENSILHGLKDVEEKGIILIRVSTEENRRLIIEIEDNGVGMSAEDLAALQERINRNEETTTSNIGLHNINQRIKLFYGDRFGITINSNNGTCVRLCLPLLPNS